MSHRRIGLTVEQPRDGCYFWVIHEDVGGDGHYQRVESASEARQSYAQALADGFGMLQRIQGHDGLNRLQALRSAHGLPS
jgi:hypothetical protein